MHKQTIAITAGGTGGHFYPALAIALEMKKRGFHVIMYISGQNCTSFSELASQNDLEVCIFQADRLKQCVLKPWRLFRTLRRLRRHMIRRNVKIMLGMGSFAAFPACLAAKLAGIPLVLHEGNAIPGKSNRYLSFLANAVAISLPLKSAKSLHCRKIVQTGLPLRAALLNIPKLNEYEQNKAYVHAQLDAQRKTLLIFGGSQGAKAINTMVLNMLKLPNIEKIATQIQVIHLTGTENNDELVQAYREAQICAKIKSHDNAIEKAYQLADLVICRSGASTISELSIWNKHAFFIPLPSAADDHQTANAEVAQQAGLGLCLKQSELTPECLLTLIIQWLNKENCFNAPNPKITLCYPNATDRVADLLMQEIHNS